MITSTIQNSVSSTMPLRRLRRWIAVVAMVSAGLFAGAVAASPASAANFDFRGALITASSATASAGVNCDHNSGKLAITFGTNGVAPQYYRYAVRNRYATAWSSWSGWGTVGGSRFTQFGIITRAGDWEVIVEIAHWSNGYYYYDAEYTNVSNYHPLYSNSRFCHVGY